jgi:hypothetical protein
MNYEQWTEVLCVTLLKTPLVPTLSKSFEATIHIHTNLSFFYLPIQLYNGLLTVRYYYSILRSKEQFGISIRSISFRFCLEVGIGTPNVVPISRNGEHKWVPVPRITIRYSVFLILILSVFNLR